MDLGFIAKKLRHVCLVLSHQAVFKRNYNFGLLDQILPYVERENLTRHPAIGLYYHAGRFLSDPAAEDHFFAFRQMLFQYAEAFPGDELRALYLLAINFGVKKNNMAPNQAWDRANFDLYKEALARDLLLDKGQLSHFSYNNIVIAAMRLGETAWAEEFIHQYKPHLERKYRESTFNMNMARLAYLQKDYHAALLHLQRADYRDFIHSMNAKTLQMKIYYDTAAWQSLDSLLDSVAIYLRRKKVLGYHKENFSNIVRFMQRLLALPPGNSAAREALRQESENCKVLSERGWFLQKMGYF